MPFGDVVGDTPPRGESDDVDCDDASTVQPSIVGSGNYFNKTKKIWSVSFDCTTTDRDFYEHSQHYWSQKPYEDLVLLSAVGFHRGQLHHGTSSITQYVLTHPRPRSQREVRQASERDDHGDDDEDVSPQRQRIFCRHPIHTTTQPIIAYSALRNSTSTHPTHSAQPPHPYPRTN